MHVLSATPRPLKFFLSEPPCPAPPPTPGGPTPAVGGPRCSHLGRGWGSAPPRLLLVPMAFPLSLSAGSVFLRRRFSRLLQAVFSLTSGYFPGRVGASEGKGGSERRARLQSGGAHRGAGGRDDPAAGRQRRGRGRGGPCVGAGRWGRGISSRASLCFGMSAMSLRKKVKNNSWNMKNTVTLQCCFVLASRDE